MEVGKVSSSLYTRFEMSLFAKFYADFQGDHMKFPIIIWQTENIN